MPKKAAFTRDSAIAYLERRGLLTKAPGSYSTDYVKRLASQYSRAEQQGKSISRAKARGKAGPEHIVPNYMHGPLPEGTARDRFSEQYRIWYPETVSDLRSLKNAVDRRRKQKGLAIARIYTVTLMGLCRYKHAGEQREADYIQQTLAMHVSRLDLNDYLKNHPDMDIVEFVNLFWQPLREEADEWATIDSISMSVTNSFDARK